MSQYVNHFKSYVSTHYGASVRKYRCKQIHREICTSQEENMETVSEFHVFALQDITSNGIDHAYPKGRRPECVAKRAEFHAKYGLYNFNKFTKVYAREQAIWSASKTLENQEKMFFVQIGAINAILTIHKIAFKFISELSDGLLLLQYSKTYEYEEVITSLKYYDPEYYPRQDKMIRAVAITMQNIKEFRDLCIIYFATRPQLIYQLAPPVFDIYMKTHGTFEDAVYGRQLAANGWLSQELGIITGEFYETAWKNRWASVIKRFRPLEGSRFVALPTDICEMIAGFITKVDIGEPFWDYISRVYDAETRSVKTEFAHTCKITAIDTTRTGPYTQRMSFKIEMMQYL